MKSHRMVAIAVALLALGQRRPHCRGGPASIAGTAKDERRSRTPIIQSARGVKEGQVGGSIALTAGATSISGAPSAKSSRRTGQQERQGDLHRARTTGKDATKNNVVVDCDKFPRPSGCWVLAAAGVTAASSRQLRFGGCPGSCHSRSPAGELLGSVVRVFSSSIRRIR